MSNELLFDACKADTAFDAIPIMWVFHRHASTGPEHNALNLVTLSATCQELQAQIQPPDSALRLRSEMHAFALDSFTVSMHPLGIPSVIHFSPVKNHSIPSSLPQRVISSSLPFFALPEEEKLKYDIRKSTSFKGYNALLSGNTDPEGRGDLHEGFNIGWEALEGHESQTKANAWYDQNSTMGGANVWPEGGEDMKEFRVAMLEY